MSTGSIGASAWVVVPLLGGLIGYLTNYLAVRMIFRPIRPTRVLGITFQGLIGRRQKELAESIGRVVGGHLFRHEDIVGALGKIDLERLVGSAVQRGLDSKLEELKRRMPMVAGFLSEERVTELRRLIVKGLLEHQDTLVAELERAIEAGVDVQSIVSEKVAAFPVERLEALVLEISSKELRHIEWLGAVLGVLIGFAQVAVLHLL